MRAAEFHVRDVALVILTVLAVLYTLYFAAGIILPFVLAVVLGLLLSPAARFMCHRLRLPRMLAARAADPALFSAIGGIGYAISVPAAGGSPARRRACRRCRKSWVSCGNRSPCWRAACSRCRR